jgi:membrane-associated protease RseP (regulator of RpoE activity)
MTTWNVLKLCLAAYVLWSLIVVLLIVHEWGHLLAMKKIDMRPDKVVIGSIKLFSVKLFRLDYEVGLIPMWGFVSSKAYEKASTRDRAIVAAAGPAMSLVTGLAFWAANALHHYWLIALLMKGSFLLVATNLIPFPPLDGWGIVEHFVVKAGIRVTPRARQYLLCAGFAAIAILILLR